MRYDPLRLLAAPIRVPILIWSFGGPYEGRLIFMSRVRPPALAPPACAAPQEGTQVISARPPAVPVMVLPCCRTLSDFVAVFWMR